MLIGSSLLAQSLNFEFDASNSKVTKIIFRDTLGKMVDKIDIRTLNPYNHFVIPVKSIDQYGHKTYIASRKDFLDLFPTEIRKTFVDSINLLDIDSVKLFSTVDVSKTENKYVVINSNLMASDPKHPTMYGSKGIIYIIDSSNSIIYESEIIPSASGYAAVSNDGKYLAFTYGLIGPHEIIYPDGIQIREVTSNKIVFNIEAINYGVEYNEKCKMITSTIQVADGLRYLFFNEKLKCIFYIDLNDEIDRLMTVSEKSIVIQNSNKNTYEVTFNQMSKLLF